MTSRRTLVAFIAAASACACTAADWPQYGGPNLNRTTTETLQKTWPAGGPKTLWKVPTEGGFSSFAVSGGKAFTLVLREVNGARTETLIALDANTGKELWAAPLVVFKTEGGGDSGTPDNKGGDGPRSTPSVDGNRVYVTSHKLVVSCYDAENGKQVWTRDLIKENAGRNITWANAASPLIEGDILFVAGGGAGQSLLGLNKTTGEVVWKAHDEKMTHATPVAATILGQRQVIFFTQSGLVSVNPKDGALLWKHPFRYSTSTAASPVVDKDIVYCAAGYGVGASAARISKDGSGFKATQLWSTQGNKPVANHWSTPVALNGHLYGLFSFKEYGNGPMKCVDLATGTVKWEQAGFGAGQVILAGDTVVALSDKGEIVQVQATPAAYKEISRAKVLAGKCWSTPTLANGRLFARSTKEGVCLQAGVLTSSR
jgi:outer membrane protein assembly factor BamB